MRGAPILTARAQRLRREATDAERCVGRHYGGTSSAGAFAGNIRYAPFIVDFACLEARLIVEADGSQHTEPGDHDRRDAILGARGWSVLRFWNIDILKNREGVPAIIGEALSPGQRQRPPS